jgi:isoleucyl-tRNA synthetase
VAGAPSIGSGLEAAVWITAAPEDLPDLLRRKRALLPTLFIVSEVHVGEPPPPATLMPPAESAEIPGLIIAVDRAAGEKCQRCWKYSRQVGASGEHPGLCERCLPVVLGLGAAR